MPAASWAVAAGRPSNNTPSAYSILPQLLVVSDVRKPHTLVPIPRQLATAIDKVAGQKRHAAFIVDVAEREIRRREQRDALSETAGSWKDKDQEHQREAE